MSDNKKKRKENDTLPNLLKEGYMIIEKILLKRGRAK